MNIKPDRHSDLGFCLLTDLFSRMIGGLKLDGVNYFLIF